MGNSQFECSLSALLISINFAACVQDSDNAFTKNGSEDLDGNSLSETLESAYVDSHIAKSPLQVMSWFPIHSDATNISKMATIDFSFAFDNTRPNTPGQFFETAIQRAVNQLEQLPPERRFLRLQNEFYFRGMISSNTLMHHPDDRCRNSAGDFTNEQCPWVDHGMASVRQNINLVFHRLRELGADIRGVILDSETRLSNWVMSPSQLNAVQNDPRFMTQLYPLLGFGRYNLAERVLAFQRPNTDYLKFNSVLGILDSNYENQAVFEPIRALFPNIILSQYNFHKEQQFCPEAPEQLCGVSDSNGHRNYLFSGAVVGNAQSESIYGSLGQITALNTPPEMGATYSATAFNSFKYMVNRSRALALVDEPIDTHIWIARKDWVDSLVPVAPIVNSDEYDEAFLHMAMTGIKYYLYWNYSEGFNYSEATPSPDDFTAERSIDRLLAELNSMAGYADRRMIDKTLTPWVGRDFVTTTAIAGGRLLTRVTLELAEGDSVARRVERAPDGDLIVRTPQYELRFSKGVTARIQNSRIGVWVSQPVGAPIVVTRMSFEALTKR